MEKENKTKKPVGRPRCDKNKKYYCQWCDKSIFSYGPNSWVVQRHLETDTCKWNRKMKEEEKQNNHSAIIAISSF